MQMQVHQWWFLNRGHSRSCRHTTRVRERRTELILEGRTSCSRLRIVRRQQMLDPYLRDNDLHPSR